MPCYFCETEPRESTFGYWCKDCRELKNICNVYGFKRSLDILKKCCIRNDEEIKSLCWTPRLREGREQKISRENKKIFIKSPPYPPYFYLYLFRTMRFLSHFVNNDFIKIDSENPQEEGIIIRNNDYE